MPLKILFIGDVVGSPGRKIVSQVLPRLIRRWGLGLVVCNAENAAGGSGLTIRCHEDLARPASTSSPWATTSIARTRCSPSSSGRHASLRPANFPPDAPGEGVALVEARDGTPVAVFTVLGRTYMRPVD